MFDQFKQMGALAGLMKDKERLREMGEEFQHRLERMSVTGAAGSGAVRVTVTGKMVVTSVELDPAVLAGAASDKAMVEGLIQEATNDALERVRSMIAEQARRFADEMGLGDLPGMEGITKMLGA